jgi:hypothetical protein
MRADARRPQRGGDPGDHLARDALRGQKLQLLGGAAEDHGVAALHPRHAPPLPRAQEHEVHDLFLRRGALAPALAHHEDLGVGAGVGDHRGVDQGVAHHRVGLADALRAAKGEEPGVSRAGADEGDQRCHGARESSTGLRLPRGR